MGSIVYALQTSFKIACAKHGSGDLVLSIHVRLPASIPRNVWQVRLLHVTGSLVDHWTG